MLAQGPHWPPKTGQKTPRKVWQRSILFSWKTSRDPLFRHHRSSQLSGSTKPNRFSASNHFVRTRARFTHKQSFRYPRLGTFVRIHWVARLRLNDCLIKTKKRSAGSPVRSAYLFDSIEWLTHARPFFFVLWLLLVLADGFSSVLWRNAKTKTVSFLYTRSVLPPLKPFRNFMNRPTKCQRLFVKKPWPKSATTSCRHAGPKPCPEKKLLGKRRHTRDRLPVAYWLKKRADKRHEGPWYPR